MLRRLAHIIEDIFYLIAILLASTGAVGVAFGHGPSRYWAVAFVLFLSLASILICRAIVYVLIGTPTTLSSSRTLRRS